MNRTGLRRRVAARTGLSLRQSARAVDALFDAIARELASGESVTVRGLGRLRTTSTRAGRRTVRLTPQRTRPAPSADTTSTSSLLGGAMDQKGNQDERAEHGESRNETTPLGLDVGTSRIVLSRGVGPGAKTETQLNAFVSVPYSKFTESILKQNKVN